MEEIKYKLLIKNDKFSVYEIYLKRRKHYVGKVYFIRKENKIIIKHNFNDSEFNSMVGMIMLNDILNIGLRDFNDAKISKIKTKNDVYINYYLDSFDVEKEEVKNGVSYTLKRWVKHFIFFLYLI